MFWVFNEKVGNETLFTDVNDMLIKDVGETLDENNSDKMLVFMDMSKEEDAS